MASGVGVMPPVSPFPPPQAARQPSEERRSMVSNRLFFMPLKIVPVANGVTPESSPERSWREVARGIARCLRFASLSRMGTSTKQTSGAKLVLFLAVVVMLAGGGLLFGLLREHAQAPRPETPERYLSPSDSEQNPPAPFAADSVDEDQLLP